MVPSRPRQELAYIGQLAGNSGGRRHYRAYKMGAGPLALAAHEVAVGRRGATFAGRHQVAVHPDAHRASGFSPLESGALEDRIEAFRLRLRFHETRTWYRHSGNDRAAAIEHLRGGAKVFDAAVGAGA